MKKYFLILAFILLAAIRFVWTDKVPPGLSNDDIQYMVSAKSYALYGKDISGIGLPASLVKTYTAGAISPVPALALSLPLQVFPLNQTTVRVVYIVVNLLTAISLYFLVLALFKDKHLGLLSAAVFLLNPWSLYLSRTASDTAFALLFYIAGLATLIKLRGKGLIIPFLLFMLAFFSYHGGKFIFMPVILFGIAFKAYEEKINPLKSRAVLGFFAATLAIIVLFFVASRLTPDSTLLSRSGDLFFTDNNKISAIVNDARRQAIENPLNPIFINKPAEILKIFAKQYLASFSPEILFIGGDPRATYRFGEHGFFYLVDIPLILLGLAGLYAKKRNVFYILMALVAISPISTALSKVEVSVINRSFLLLPVFIIFISYGILELLSLFRSRVVKILVTISIVLAIGLSAANFYHFYFFRFPVTGQEKYWLSENIVSKYLSFNKEGQPVEVVTDEPWFSFFRQIFLSNSNFQRDALTTSVPYNGKLGVYQLGNISYSNLCPKELDSGKIYIISTAINCEVPDKPSFSIIDQKDAGSLFNIYNSEICKDLSKDSWRRFSYISDYGFEIMSYEDFCSTWIFASP